MDDESKALLKELVKWTRVQAFPQVKAMLEATLATDEDKIIYHFSDGQNSRDVAAAAGVSKSPVLSRWEAWYKIGLMEEIPSKGGPRKKRIFALDDFGIAVPRRAQAKTGEPNE
jgi:hypothetical protein